MDSMGRRGAKRRQLYWNKGEIDRNDRGAKTLVRFRIIVVALLMFGAGEWASKACAQAPPNKAQEPENATVPAASKTQEPKVQLHRFWDKENDWLFAGVGAARTFDYFSTLNLRRRGDNEVFLTNAVVDNHAAFAAIEAAGTGVSIGASYLFHRYGHHKLERWTSIVHFGLTSAGAVRNYSLKTAHH